MPTANVTKRGKKRSRNATKAAVVPAPVLVPAPAPTLIPEKTETDPKLSPSFAQLRIAPAILLTLITLSVYFQVMQHPFSNYDDTEYIGDNLNIQKGLSVATVRWAITSTEHANWHPLTWMSHALDWQLFGNDPSGHHFMSLLLHILSVLLLFSFLARVTGSQVRSLLVAAIFAVHPVNVESVAWIAERKNVLCMLFFLLALIAYSRYARQPNLIRYLLMALLFALALTAKPMAVTFPFVLLLLDYWPLQRIRGWSPPSTVFPAPQLSPWKIVLEKLPLLALSAADSVITVIAQRQVGAIRSTVGFPFSLRLSNALVSCVTYVWKAAFPIHLSVLYPYPSNGVPLWRLLISVLLLVGVSVWVWRERSHRPYLITGWCWFLGTLVPVIGLVQVGEQGMADRYAYLPLIGIFVMAVWGISDLVQNASEGVRHSAAFGAVVALLLFSILAWRQDGFWRSNLELWSHAVAVTDNNVAAEDAIGSLLLADALNAGQHFSNEAQVHFQRALKIDPNDAEALTNVGADLVVHGGRPQEALEKFQLAWKNATNEIWLRSRILSDMATAYEALGEYARARQYFMEAMKITPGPDNGAFLGYARTFTDEKIAKLNETLAPHPTAQGNWQLGQLEEEAGRKDAARNAYQHALDLDPKFSPARAALDKISQ